MAGVSLGLLWRFFFDRLAQTTSLVLTGAVANIIGSFVLFILNKFCRGWLCLNKNHPLNPTSAKYQQDYLNGLSEVITGPASLLSYEILKA